MARFTQFPANRFAAPALPDNGIVQRLSGGTVKDHKCLPLVGDTDASQVLLVELSC